MLRVVHLTGGLVVLLEIPQRLRVVLDAPLVTSERLAFVHRQAGVLGTDFEGLNPEQRVEALPGDGCEFIATADLPLGLVDSSLELVDVAPVRLTVLYVLCFRFLLCPLSCGRVGRVDHDLARHVWQTWLQARADVRLVARVVDEVGHEGQRSFDIHSPGDVYEHLLLLGGPLEETSEPLDLVRVLAAAGVDGDGEEAGAVNPHEELRREACEQRGKLLASLPHVGLRDDVRVVFWHGLTSDTRTGVEVG